MNDLWNRFDKSIDLDALHEDLKEVEKNGGAHTYKEVPHGHYEVAINKMELSESKKHDPMVTIWFKIVADPEHNNEYKGSFIFYNQVVKMAFQIHIVDEMLRALTQECDEEFEIKHDTYSQYGDLIMDIFECIAENFEYGLEYEANKKNYDFNTYKITDIFPLEG